MPFLYIIFWHKPAFLQKMEFCFKVKGVKKETAMMGFLSEMKTEPINITSSNNCLQRS